MSDPFTADHIDRERPDPVEGSSTRWLAVPPLLLSFFLGFGVTYLFSQTDSLQFRDGDKRTPRISREATREGSGEVSLLEVGEAVYKRNCQACHQPNGQGLASAFPPLDGSPWVNGAPERLSAIVLYGIKGEIEVAGQTYKGLMPAFQDKLSEEEIAAVASYVRSSWSNESGVVEPSLVKAVASQYKRASPWDGQGELDRQGW